MLHWQTRPDPVLTAIVDEALRMALDCARLFRDGVLTDLAGAYPEAARCFTLARWIEEVEKLRAANLSRTVFRPTDYHWLILHEILEQFSETYNDDPGEPIVHAGTTIRALDFAAIVGSFFWDLDFLIPFEELSGLGLEGRRQLGINAETVGLAAGLAPHPEELRLEEVTEPRWIVPEEGEALFVPGCGTYPAGRD